MANIDNIERFQTCAQISEILRITLNKFNGNAKSRVIQRNAGLKVQRYSHVATEVEFTDTVTGIEYRLLLDLTLDLYRIQSGLQTK